MTSIDETRPPNIWRRFTAFYATVLSALLAVTVGLLIIPVSLQIFSRYTELIPSYIWTEEMARFMFIWTIMIGAMIGVRESTYFEVDLWPRVSPRVEAAARLLGRFGVLAAACVFVWAGIEFTRFAWRRTSELAELPLWYIHVAWPVTGVTWIVFLGEQMLADLRLIFGRVA
jgi:TRAP-type C4-dicarboxylate transport system permease small subunit